MKESSCCSVLSDTIAKRFFTYCSSSECDEITKLRDPLRYHLFNLCFRYGRMCSQQRRLPTRMHQYPGFLHMRLQQRLHTARKPEGLQGRRLQIRHHITRRASDKPELPRFLSQQEGLRLALQYNSRSQTETNISNVRIGTAPRMRV